jgi:hypothetical protein
MGQKRFVVFLRERKQGAGHQTPIPATPKGMWGEHKPEKVSLSVD